jgi:hypothetical protein
VRIRAAVCGLIARGPRCKSPTLSAAISARRRPTCKPTERIARSRSPAMMSSGGAPNLARLQLRKANLESPLPPAAGGSSRPPLLGLAHIALQAITALWSRRGGRPPPGERALFALQPDFFFGDFRRAARRSRPRRRPDCGKKRTRFRSKLSCVSSMISSAAQSAHPQSC